MIYLVIAAVCLATLGALIALARRDGKQEVQNEIAEKTIAVQKKQADIAAGPSDSPDDVVKWLSNGPE